MSTLHVFLDQQLAGRLEYVPAENRFSFTYTPQWLSQKRPYAISPQLPLRPLVKQTPDVHSLAVRFFFENLLPEGRALDEAAAVNSLSKSNLVGLMIALGSETAGAIALKLVQYSADADALSPAVGEEKLRPLSRQEMSAKIRARPFEAFSVWDRKVRLSIAGFQDKVAVYQENSTWFLVDSGQRASTVIIKPEPLDKNLAGLSSNEFFCMRLAREIGLPVAEVRLVHVPEPVLEIVRFDRVIEGPLVRRRHMIDGCQLLGIPSSLKYERPYGDAIDVKNIRDGASLPRIFAALKQCPSPAAERLHLIRWTIFQILIGNTDAHAKNLSFFFDERGMRLTPAYDLVSILSLAHANLSNSFAMAIGDAFSEAELTPFEWACFAQSCGLRHTGLATELARMSSKILVALAPISQQVIGEGAQSDVVQQVAATITRLAKKNQTMAALIPGIDPELLPIPVTIPPSSNF